MNYIELVNRFWELDEVWQFNCCETRLYFYLLKTANRLGWLDNWTHSDVRTSANVGVSNNSMKNARNRLVQSGLISVKSGGNGFGDKTRYQILTPKQHPKHTPKTEPKPAPKSTPLNKLNKTKEEIPPNHQSGESEILPTEILSKIKEEEKEKKVPAKKEKEVFDLSFVDVAYISIVRDFIEYRKQIKKPFKTSRGVQMFYNELLTKSKNNLQKAKTLADYAKGKEWQTVYEIKENGKTTNTHQPIATEQDERDFIEAVLNGAGRADYERNQRLQRHEG